MRKWQLDTTGACDLPARPARRRGISLLEVLISMFVLAIGLMGVAALIPAGRHEIVEAIKLENAAMVGRGAFRDIQIREYLNPEELDGIQQDRRRRGNVPGRTVYDSTPLPRRRSISINPDEGTVPGNGSQVAFAIDPLGLTASTTYGNVFPFTV